MRKTLGTRLSAYAATSALAASGVLLLPTPAHAAPTSVAVDAGARWLAGRLVEGLLPGQFGGGDVGLSIDAALSLAEVGGHDDAVAAIAAAVGGTAGQNYVEYAYEFDGVDYAGQAANATGKALALLESLPAPSTVGTVDVLDRMEDLTTDSGSSAGRVVDFSTADGAPDGQDYANSLGQAFATRGLGAAGSTEAEAALEYLLLQQCPGGGFRLSMAAAGATAALSCTDAGAAEVDTTGIVVQQLVALGSADAQVVAAITAARTWLVSEQRSDGSWGGTGAETGSNANSTGAAVRALGQGQPAAAGAAWLRGRQVSTVERCNALAGAQGAVAYDDAAMSAGRASGITDGSRDQWERAMAPTLPALALLDDSELGAPPALSGPTGYVKARSRVNLTVSGYTEGERSCLTGPATSLGRSAPAASYDQPVTLPDGSGNRVYTVADSDGNTESHTLRALGAARFTVAKDKQRAKRGSLLTTTARGLAAGERATVYYKRAVVARGTATPEGTFAARFRVGQATGLKPIVVRGQFSDIRLGRTEVRVVR